MWLGVAVGAALRVVRGARFYRDDSRVVAVGENGAFSRCMGDSFLASGVLVELVGCIRFGCIKRVGVVRSGSSCQLTPEAPAGSLGSIGAVGSSFSRCLVRWGRTIQ